MACGRHRQRRGCTCRARVLFGEVRTDGARTHRKAGPPWLGRTKIEQPRDSQVLWLLLASRTVTTLAQRWPAAAGGRAVMALPPGPARPVARMPQLAARPLQRGMPHGLAGANNSAATVHNQRYLEPPGVLKAESPPE